MRGSDRKHEDIAEMVKYKEDAETLEEEDGAETIITNWELPYKNKFVKNVFFKKKRKQLLLKITKTKTKDDNDASEDTNTGPNKHLVNQNVG